MKQFEDYLRDTGEVGEVEEVSHSVVYVAGLPKARPMELVVLETGELGLVLSLGRDQVEVLLLSRSRLKVGVRVARMNSLLSVGVGEGLLGRVIDPLGRVLEGDAHYHAAEQRMVDVYPPGIEPRKTITEPFETGVALVDLAVPLGKGQRELVIGDRKIGKTTFLLQSMLSHAVRGGVCIYALIAKRGSDLSSLTDFIHRHTMWQQTVVVATNSADAAGMVYLTPYTAMSMAEYFRDKGKDVLVILDDLTKHAKYYRELTLLANRFPGRSAYPGDIFYLHSRLLERAGDFKTGSITCLPVAETSMGDISGYIQTNLMSMTDGHIYFDQERYNQGRRPAIDPFLSVTRVGRQTQTPLMKSLGRELSGFMVEHAKLQELLHFGGELNKEVKNKLSTGEKVIDFFSQESELIVPPLIAVIFLASIFAGMWDEISKEEMRNKMRKLTARYYDDESLKKQLAEIVEQRETFGDLVVNVEQYSGILKE